MFAGEQMSHYHESKAIRDTNGYLQPTSIVDDVPTMVLEEIEQVKLGVTEMKEELSMIKLGMDEQRKNREQRSQTWRLIVFVVVMFVVSISLKK
jgi:hypothetical protein